MFEVGKRYEFKMLEDGEVTFWGVVESYEPPLLKLADNPPMRIRFTAPGTGKPSEDVHTAPTPGRIINVTSPNFVSAVRKDE